MANHVVLKGHGVEVTYAIGANAAFVALIEARLSLSRSYRPAEITTWTHEVAGLVVWPIGQTASWRSVHPHGVLEVRAA